MIVPLLDPVHIPAELLFKFVVCDCPVRTGMKSRKAVRLFPKLEIGEFYESY
jgi:hypothetical protein